MQIFELHFNPKKEDHSFDTFIYEPENVVEKRLGSLYMAGEVKNALPKAGQLLSDIAKVLKRSFYNISFKNPEKALPSALKSANEFLAQELKKENVNWLGNLGFSVLALRGSNLVFAKTGEVKILLIRNGQINDIGQNLNLEGIDPYPLRVFLNVASGALAENDILLVLSKSVFSFIKEKGILTRMAKTPGIDQKKIKGLLPHSLFSKGDGCKVSGFSLVFLIKKEKGSLSAIFKPLDKKEKHFSFVVKPLKSSLQKVKALIPKRRIHLPRIKNPFVSLKIAKTPVIEKFKKTSKAKKKIILVISFLVLLLLGFLIFKTTENKNEKEIRLAFEQIEKTVEQAESFLIISDKGQADKLFKQAFREILVLTEKETSLMPSILSLKETIERNLEKLNNLEKIKDPEIAFVLQEQEIGFNPNKIMLSTGNIYLYKEFSPEIYRINIKSGQKDKFSLEDPIQAMDSSSGVVLAFSSAGKIYYLKKGAWEKQEISNPSFEFSLDLFSSYLFHIYFLDKKTCHIVKYSYLNDFKWSGPKKWQQDPGQTCQNPRSMVIDGSIWVLNSDNAITRYYTGSFEEKIELDIFPFAEKFTEIKTKTAASYLYILEPKNNRIVITAKNGDLIKQFQSEKFSNLKGFTIEENGKTIYLLNDLTIYKLEI